MYFLIGPTAASVVPCYFSGCWKNPAARLDQTTCPGVVLMPGDALTFEPPGKIVKHSLDKLSGMLQRFLGSSCGPAMHLWTLHPARKHNKAPTSSQLRNTGSRTARQYQCCSSGPSIAKYIYTNPSHAGLFST